MYIGGDNSDEYAFETVEGDGLGVVVKSDTEATAASCIVSNPDKVAAFFSWLAGEGLDTLVAGRRRDTAVIDQRFEKQGYKNGFGRSNRNRQLASVAVFRPPDSYVLWGERNVRVGERAAALLVLRLRGVERRNRRMASSTVRFTSCTFSTGICVMKPFVVESGPSGTITVISINRE